eukprot:TRINITY_DN4595_c1_g1_i1.p1 TRINITY_DN4595_c1_g1~~TRINITY_DN4595_c1_g1_i1.p1  ORF type:complete len:914 (+),score=213.96 TRINITY_DN4595_c1_g1_i1:375-2744(+)
MKGLDITTMVWDGSQFTVADRDYAAAQALPAEQGFTASHVEDHETFKDAPSIIRLWMSRVLDTSPDLNDYVIKADAPFSMATAQGAVDADGALLAHSPGKAREVSVTLAGCAAFASFVSAPYITPTPPPTPAPPPPTPAPPTGAPPTLSPPTPAPATPAPPTGAPPTPAPPTPTPPTPAPPVPPSAFQKVCPHETRQDGAFPYGYELGIVGGEAYIRFEVEVGAGRWGAVGFREEGVSWGAMKGLDVVSFNAQDSAVHDHDVTDGPGAPQRAPAARTRSTLHSFDPVAGGGAKLSFHRPLRPPTGVSIPLSAPLSLATAAGPGADTPGSWRQHDVHTVQDVTIAPCPTLLRYLPSALTPTPPTAAPPTSAPATPVPCPICEATPAPACPDCTACGSAPPPTPAPAPPGLTAGPVSPPGNGTGTTNETAAPAPAAAAPCDACPASEAVLVALIVVSVVLGAVCGVAAERWRQRRNRRPPAADCHEMDSLMMPQVGSHHSRRLQSEGSREMSDLHPSSFIEKGETNYEPPAEPPPAQQSPMTSTRGARGRRRGETARIAGPEPARAKSPPPSMLFGEVDDPLDRTHGLLSETARSLTVDVGNASYSNVPPTEHAPVAPVTTSQRARRVRSGYHETHENDEDSSQQWKNGDRNSGLRTRNSGLRAKFRAATATPGAKSPVLKSSGDVTPPTRGRAGTPIPAGLIARQAGHPSDLELPVPSTASPLAPLSHRPRGRHASKPPTRLSPGHRSAASESGLSLDAGGFEERSPLRAPRSATPASESGLALHPSTSH